VAFIALTFGTNQHDVPLAAIAAVSAILVVAAVGVAIRAPLARVPENTMKLVVGVMLTSFGMFWGAEGAGARWPHSDAALLVLAPATLLLALATIGALGWRRARDLGLPSRRPRLAGSPSLGRQAADRQAAEDVPR
jgi:uncharacterized membrane protein